MTAWNLRIMMNWSPTEFLKVSLCLLIGFDDCGEKKSGEMIDAKMLCFKLYKKALPQQSTVSNSQITSGRSSSFYIKGIFWQSIQKSRGDHHSMTFCKNLVDFYKINPNVLFYSWADGLLKCLHRPKINQMSPVVSIKCQIIHSSKLNEVSIFFFCCLGFFFGQAIMTITRLNIYGRFSSGSRILSTTKTDIKLDLSEMSTILTSSAIQNWRW